MIIFIETTFSHKYGFQRGSHKIKNTVYHIECDDATVFTQWKGLFTGNIVNDPVSPKLTSTQTSYYHAIKDFNSLSQTIRECEYIFKRAPLNLWFTDFSWYLVRFIL